MSQFSPQTISDFGLLLKQQGYFVPNDSIEARALERNIVYRIGTRYLTSCFLLKRRQLYTVYVNPTYSSYRNAFKEAIQVSVTGADIDHYFAKAAAKFAMTLESAWREAGVAAAAPEGRIFVALGAIPLSLNRSLQDKDDLATMIAKLIGGTPVDARTREIIGMKRYDDPVFAERVLATGFQVPHSLVRWSSISRVTAANLRGSRETDFFSTYL